LRWNLLEKNIIILLFKFPSPKSLTDIW